jgi:methionine aminopeptidase
MKISIKSAEEIKKMRIAGKLAAEVLEMITPHVVPVFQLENWINYVTNLS